MTKKLLTLENIRSGAVPSDAVAVGFLLGEIERLTKERDEYKIWWERDSKSLGTVLNELSLERACKQDRLSQIERQKGQIERLNCKCGALAYLQYGSAGPDDPWQAKLDDVTKPLDAEIERLQAENEAVARLLWKNDRAGCIEWAKGLMQRWPEGKVTAHEPLEQLPTHDSRLERIQQERLTWAMACECTCDACEKLSSVIRLACQGASRDASSKK